MLGQNLRMIRQGFTLIELMIVIVLIGTLTAFALPYLWDNIEKGRYLKINHDLDQLAEASRLFAMKSEGTHEIEGREYYFPGAYPDSIEELFDSGMIDFVPSSPFGTNYQIGHYYVFLSFVNRSGREEVLKKTIFPTNTDFFYFSPPAHPTTSPNYDLWQTFVNTPGSVYPSGSNLPGRAEFQSGRVFLVAEDYKLTETSDERHDAAAILKLNSRYIPAITSRSDFIDIKLIGNFDGIPVSDPSAGVFFTDFENYPTIMDISVNRNLPTLIGGSNSAVNFGFLFARNHWKLVARFNDGDTPVVIDEGGFRNPLTVKFERVLSLNPGNAVFRVFLNGQEKASRLGGIELPLSVIENNHLFITPNPITIELDSLGGGGSLTVHQITVSTMDFSNFYDYNYRGL